MKYKMLEWKRNVEMPGFFMATVMAVVAIAIISLLLTLIVTTVFDFSVLIHFTLCLLIFCLISFFFLLWASRSLRVAAKETQRRFKAIFGIGYYYQPYDQDSTMQALVHRVLKDLALTVYNSSADTIPPAELRRRKKNFRQAQDVARLMGFNAWPKIKDYVKAHTLSQTGGGREAER